MTTKRTSAESYKTRPNALRQPSPYHQLDTLIHTMRCIAQYQDALCGIAHEAKREGALSSDTIDELREILETIPSRDYVFDVDAVKAAVVEQPPSRTLRKTKSAKAVINRKRLSVSAKQSGRKSSK